MEQFTLTNFSPHDRIHARKQSLDGIKRLKQICFPKPETLNQSAFESKNLADSFVMSTQLKMKDFFDEHNKLNRSFSNIKPRHTDGKRRNRSNNNSLFLGRIDSIGERHNFDNNYDDDEKGEQRTIDRSFVFKSDIAKRAMGDELKACTKLRQKHLNKALLRRLQYIYPQKKPREVIDDKPLIESKDQTLAFIRKMSDGLIKNLEKNLKGLSVSKVSEKRINFIMSEHMKELDSFFNRGNAIFEEISGDPDVTVKAYINILKKCFNDVGDRLADALRKLSSMGEKQNSLEIMKKSFYENMMAVLNLNSKLNIREIVLKLQEEINLEKLGLFFLLINKSMANIEKERRGWAFVRVKMTSLIKKKEQSHARRLYSIRLLSNLAKHSQKSLWRSFSSWKEVIKIREKSMENEIDRLENGQSNSEDLRIQPYFMKYLEELNNLESPLELCRCTKELFFSFFRLQGLKIILKSPSENIMRIMYSLKSESEEDFDDQEKSLPGDVILKLDFVREYENKQYVQMRTRAEAKVLIPLTLWNRDLVGYIQLEEEAPSHTGENIENRFESGASMSFHETAPDFKKALLSCIKTFANRIVLLFKNESPDSSCECSLSITARKETSPEIIIKEQLLSSLVNSYSYESLSRAFSDCFFCAAENSGSKLRFGMFFKSPFDPTHYFIVKEHGNLEIIDEMNPLDNLYFQWKKPDKKKTELVPEFSFENKISLGQVSALDRLREFEPSTKSEECSTMELMTGVLILNNGKNKEPEILIFIAGPTRLKDFSLRLLSYLQPMLSAIAKQPRNHNGEAKLGEIRGATLPLDYQKVSTTDIESFLNSVFQVAYPQLLLKIFKINQYGSGEELEIKMITINQAFNIRLESSERVLLKNSFFVMNPEFVNESSANLEFDKMENFTTLFGKNKDKTDVLNLFKKICGKIGCSTTEELLAVNLNKEKKLIICIQGPGLFLWKLDKSARITLQQSISNMIFAVDSLINENLRRLILKAEANLASRHNLELSRCMNKITLAKDKKIHELQLQRNIKMLNLLVHSGEKKGIRGCFSKFKTNSYCKIKFLWLRKKPELFYFSKLVVNMITTRKRVALTSLKENCLNKRPKALKPEVRLIFHQLFHIIGKRKLLHFQALKQLRINTKRNDNILPRFIKKLDFKTKNLTFNSIKQYSQIRKKAFDDLFKISEYTMIPNPLKILNLLNEKATQLSDRTLFVFKLAISLENRPECKAFAQAVTPFELYTNTSGTAGLVERLNSSRRGNSQETYLIISSRCVSTGVRVCGELCVSPLQINQVKPGFQEFFELISKLILEKIRSLFSKLRALRSLDRRFKLQLAQQAFTTLLLHSNKNELQLFQTQVREENQTAKELMNDLSKDIEQLNLEKKAKTKCLASSLLNSAYLFKRLESMLTRHFLFRWRFSNTRSKITENALSKILKLNKQHSGARYEAAFFLINFFKIHYQKKLKLSALKILAAHFVTKTNQLLCESESPFRNLIDYSSRTDPNSNLERGISFSRSVDEISTMSGALDEITNKGFDNRIELGKLAYIASTRKNVSSNINKGRGIENRDFFLRKELSNSGIETTVTARSHSGYKLSSKTKNFLKKINQRELSFDGE